MSEKVHARKFVGHNCCPGGTEVYEEYEPLCGARPIDPMFSDAEFDCLRCRRILDRSRGDGRAKIEGGSIVIRVSIGNLPSIINNGPHSDEIRCTDAGLFAHDLVAQLQEEAEDGTTAVHKLFDDAVLRAFENGAMGVESRTEEPSEPLVRDIHDDLARSRVR